MTEVKIPVELSAAVIWREVCKVLRSVSCGASVEVIPVVGMYLLTIEARKDERVLGVPSILTEVIRAGESALSCI